jgi:hypothetical protein
MNLKKYSTFIILLLLSNTLHSSEKINQNSIEWILDRAHIQTPRGGNTNGLPTEIDTSVSKYFTKLQNLSDKKDKDKHAILSMIGEYRANFEFTEMFGGQQDYPLDAPYKSWGTEIILPITNREDLISLQHILVMYMQDKDGNVQGPYVQKHWRQDWTYEDKNIFVFEGDKKWVNKNIEDVSGTWSQAVYQVDDSPRYESYGLWEHEKGVSRWISDVTPRPLPRREFSVRSDYNLISAINKISVMKWGWIMEEINDKIQTPDNYIGSEYGLARYQKIKNYEFQPAYDYWNETKEYWNMVREAWSKILSENTRICLEDKIDDSPLYIYKFAYAEEFRTNKSLIGSYKNINNILNKFLDKKC